MVGDDFYCKLSREWNEEFVSLASQERGSRDLVSGCCPMSGTSDE